MLHIKEAIVVEGRYDKHTLSQVVDTVILETRGFGVFKNRELMVLLRRLANERGLIILTDSDGGGLLIRNHMKSCIPPHQIKQAYIPEIYGKERRKTHGGKEGKLGVEGMPPSILEEALRRSGATILGEAPSIPFKDPLTKADLFALELIGVSCAKARREALLAHLNLPKTIPPNGLLPILNALYPREEFLKEVAHWTTKPPLKNSLA